MYGILAYSDGRVFFGKDEEVKYFLSDTKNRLNQIVGELNISHLLNEDTGINDAILEIKKYIINKNNITKREFEIYGELEFLDYNVNLIYKRLSSGEHVGYQELNNFDKKRCR